MFKDNSSLPKWFISPKIQPTKSSIHGIGITALDDIASGEIIERSPMFLFSRETLNVLWENFEETHVLGDYVYYWDAKSVASVFGYAMIYNHSSEPNVLYRKKRDIPCIEFVAIKDIQKGEEICTSYYHGPLGKSITFSDTGSHCLPGQLSPKAMRSLWKKNQDD